MIFSIVSLILKLSGLIFCVMPIRSIVRNGEMPEFPERVKENAVLDMALSIKLMVLPSGSALGRSWMDCF